MSSYKRYLIFLFMVLLFTGCVSKNLESTKIEQTTINKKQYDKIKHKDYFLENQYIVFALEYERQREYAKARSLYYKLFKKTNKYEYFLKFLSLSFYLSDYETVEKYAPDSFELNIKQAEQIKRFYVLSVMQLQKYKKAKIVAKALIEDYKKDVNYELLGSVYLQNKEYKRALEVFKKAYGLNSRVQNLITISNLNHTYLNKKEEAKEVLEEFIEQNGYNYKISVHLLNFYEKDKEYEKATKLLKKLYIMYNEKINSDTLRNILVKYLLKKDIYEAIDFFEKNDKNSDVLIYLYQRANESKKALELLKRVYEQNNDLKYLAQIAILEFELAENKQTVLFDVIRKFEKVLDENSNPIYQNYLAYILIDYDIDVHKGLKLVKKALKQEPDNAAFIDTLAWGEYKVDNCTSAYKNMKRVVEEAGLEDEEIKYHWDKIKECNK